MTKKFINDEAKITIDDVYDKWNSNSLDAFISKLEAINEELTSYGWKDLEIKLDVDQGYYDDSGEMQIHICGQRLETAEEYASRLKKEERELLQKKALAIKKANAAKKKEAEELAEYARLKAKYEK